MTPDVLERLRGRLIVSCQAAGGGPLDEPGIIAALARAAVIGGAAGVRIAGTSHIRAVRKALDVPIIGLVKRRTAGSAVYITPTAADGMRVAAAGADIVAIDATLRSRPNAETVAEIIAQLCGQGVAVLADVDSVAAATAALEAGAHAVATTLAGYTSGRPVARPDIALVAAIALSVPCPVVAEGRYRSSVHVRAAFAAGAYAVVVGDAITNPAGITARLVAATPASGRRGTSEDADP
jgi:N-acylglucosamine-6-phosphate 2-epimerase